MLEVTTKKQELLFRMSKNRAYPECKNMKNGSYISVNTWFNSHPIDFDNSLFSNCP